jgi:predicted XRE-type DNA-binding protein
MAKRLVEGIAVETGSGNVFADLGLPDAEKLKIKSGLVIEITRAVRQLGLTQEEAGRRMGIPQPKVSALLRGDFANLSERKLMDCLNRLGYDIAIQVKPAAEPVGHRTLAIGGEDTKRNLTHPKLHIFMAG